MSRRQNLMRCPQCLKPLERLRILSTDQMEWFERRRFPEDPGDSVQLYWPGIVRDTAEPMRWDQIINPGHTDHWLVIHTH